MVSIIITTYYIDNLHISLFRLKWLNFDYHLIIHNDNPDVILDSRYLKECGYEGSAIIINEHKNLGCYDSRIVSIKYVLDNLKDTTHIIFCDDDDILLNPEFSNKLITNHNALVVSRLRDQLSLMVSKPDINNLINTSEFITDERPKMGCVGVSYKVELFQDLIPVLDKFKPLLSRYHGSERILEPDDVYIMNFIRIYLEKRVGPDFINRCYHYSQNYSYSLTFLEDREGRYFIEPGVNDLRYGSSTNTTYKDLIDGACKLFSDFIN